MGRERPPPLDVDELKEQNETPTDSEPVPYLSSS